MKTSMRQPGKTLEGTSTTERIHLVSATMRWPGNPLFYNGGVVDYLDSRNSMVPSLGSEFSMAQIMIIPRIMHDDARALHQAPHILYRARFPHYDSSTPQFWKDDLLRWQLRRIADDVINR